MNRNATGLAAMVMACALAVAQLGCPETSSPSMDAVEVAQTDPGKPHDPGKPGDDGTPDDGGLPPDGGSDLPTDIPVDIPDPGCLKDSHCDDGTPCTDDQCVDGKCVYKVVPDCCDDDGDCADNDPCTSEKCVMDASGMTLCQFIPIEGCCHEDVECEDGDPCTDDFCADNLCAHEPIPNCGGCQTAEDCDDGDYCTEDECLMDTGPDGEEQTSCANHDIPGCCHDDGDCEDGPACAQGQCVLVDPVAPLYECHYIPLPGCCVADWQCDDNDPCTTDLCGDDGSCSYVPSPDCCTSNIDCQDFDPCTDDFCDDGMCLNLFKPGCCKVDEDCLDDDPCTKTFCMPLSGIMPGQCMAEQIPGCCTGAADCNDMNPCTNNACLNGECVFSPLPGCCLSDQECADDDPCTKDYCQLMSGVMPGMCIHQPDPACTCDDGNVCTEDFMTSDGQCQHAWIPACCNTVSDCLMGDLCSKAQCLNHACVYGTLICNDNDPCTDDACDPATGQCIYAPRSCSDGNPCTEDACDASTGACLHKLLDCDDGNDCTKDGCDTATGQCAYFWLPWCCQADDECKDDNPCTFDEKCQAGGCTYTSMDCDDGKECTLDFCNPLTGTCIHDAASGCDDGDACTWDWCHAIQNFKCVHSVQKCDDGDPCTSDTCDSDVGCIHSLEAGCEPGCGQDSECNDGNPCTNDQCLNDACNHSWSGDCCWLNDDCDDGNPCTWDLCDPPGKPPKNSQCRHFQLPGCADNPCQDDQDCEDSDPCTLDICDAATGICGNPPDPDCCQPGDTWLADFDGGSEEGFSFIAVPSNVKWQVAGSRYHSPAFALYFGDSDTLTYADPVTGVVSGAASTPPIQVPVAPASLLKFWTWVDVETIPQYDVFSVTIHADDGDHVVWNKSLLAPGQYKTWTEVTINVTPYQGQAITVTFSFDSVDHLYNGTEGVWVDDVSVEALCETLPWCQTDDECLDDNPCTKDLCTGNTCVHEVILGCCLGDSDCDDKYPCTDDKCEDNECIHHNIPGCCIDPAECDDGNPCTDDLCIDGTCVHVPGGGPDCCSADTDCDDSDPCTVGTCEAHLCVYEPAPDCCTPDAAFFQNFPVNSLGGFTVVDDGSAVKWQVDNYRYFDEPFALYYGNPETHNYATGAATTGTATSPWFQLPPYGTPVLTFQTYLDVEVGTPYDNLVVWVQTESSKFAVWSKASLTDPGVYHKWTAVSVEMAEFAGETISLIFEFDSVDGNLNELEGVYIDMISVDVVCPAP